MDIEHIKHRHFKPSLAVALAISMMVVIGAALLGRGTLNLKGAVLLSEPRDVTVIALVEPKLEKGIHISGITFLRKEDAPAGEKPLYAYHVKTSDESDYFARLKFDTQSAEWTLERFEKLHGN